MAICLVLERKLGVLNDKEPELALSLSLSHSLIILIMTVPSDQGHRYRYWYWCPRDIPTPVDIIDMRAAGFAGSLFVYVESLEFRDSFHAANRA